MSSVATSPLCELGRQLFGPVVFERGGQQPVHHHVRVAPDRGREVGVERHAQRVVPVLRRVRQNPRAEILGRLATGGRGDN